MILTTNANHDDVFVASLLKRVEDTIALVSNKDYKNNIYNLAVTRDMGTYSDLLQYRDILDKILKCHSCYNDEDFKIEDIVSQVLLAINKC